MNIHPFDNNHTSTRFPAVTQICLDVYFNTDFITADTDNKLNHHHVHDCKELPFSGKTNLNILRSLQQQDLRNVNAKYHLH